MASLKEKGSVSIGAPAQRVAAAQTPRGVAHVLKSRQGFSDMSALRLSFVESTTMLILVWATAPYWTDPFFGVAGGRGSLLSSQVCRRIVKGY
jgi:hypothetical protein